MNAIDRLRIESAILRYDFWLEMRGLKGARRRDLRRELRANLRDASGDVGTTRALFGIGSPKELAYAATDADPSRPRWSQGLLWATGTLLLLLVWLAITTATIIATLNAAPAADSAEVSPFPWFGTTFAVTSTPDLVKAHVEPVWQLFWFPVLVFLLVAQPWRRLRRRRGDLSPTARR